MRRGSLIGALLSALLLFPGAKAMAQPRLLPSIGSDARPDDSVAICPIPVYTGDFNASGYRIGDTVPDFTLYTSDGRRAHLREELMRGRPVLLVGSSYTCPVYRGRVADVNALQRTYGNRISIFVIYVVEGRPVTDPSPYRGVEWTMEENSRVGISCRQPTTYGERVAIAREMSRAMDLKPPLLIDGPCNEWWSHFGPAPNGAYLIDTNGVVAAHHGWMNRGSNNMGADIRRLLKRRRR